MPDVSGGAQQIASEVRKLSLIAEFIRVDPASLRYRDRLDIERSLFRVASIVAKRPGPQLSSLVGERIQSVAKSAAPTTAKLIMMAGALKQAVAEVSTVDAYVNHPSVDPTVERLKQVRRLASRILRFVRLADTIALRMADGHPEARRLSRHA